MITLNKEDAFTIVDIISKAQEIVRCKDCRHKCIKGKTTQYHYCEIWKSAVDETDFCSRGEKKDE